MKFRPCIDIHNGKVKQIVGSSLRDNENRAVDNFVSDQDGAWYGQLYKKKNLVGGHIIILNPEGSEYYEADVLQAKLALEAFPYGLMVGGGINPKNAKTFLDAGATHVIVTSYVFKDGQIHFDKIQEMVQAVGREHLVLDLSCRKKEDAYYIVTDRWQKYTDVVVNHDILNRLAPYCSEFLIHAVDVEGKSSGIEEELVMMLGQWNGIPITYAGGISCKSDIEKVKMLGNNNLDITIGSALDLFGGPVEFDWAADIGRF